MRPLEAGCANRLWKQTATKGDKRLGKAASACKMCRESHETPIRRPAGVITRMLHTHPVWDVQLVSHQPVLLTMCMLQSFCAN